MMAISSVNKQTTRTGTQLFGNGDSPDELLNLFSWQNMRGGVGRKSVHCINKNMVGDNPE